MASLFKRRGKGYWIASWFDAEGVRRSRSTRTTDKRAAERIAAELEAREALIREGVLDPRALKLAEEGRRPIREHVETFLADLAARGRGAKHVSKFAQHLRAHVEEQRVQRLADLSAEGLAASMAALRAKGRSARTQNARRQALVAFGNWCVRTGRLEANPLRFVAALDEQRDRRRERRVLELAEVEALLRVTRASGRSAWYALAALAGLRRGEIERLRWGDVDLDARQVAIRGGKARALDCVPLHSRLAEELAAAKAGAGAVLPSALVFPRSPSNAERRADFERAGIELVDASGRHADVHALRGTCATLLLREGASPAAVQKLLRHADIATTFRHYAKLGIEDAARALELLPELSASGAEGAEAQRATGTEGASSALADRQQKRQHLQHESALSGAAPCSETAGSETPSGSQAGRSKSRASADLREDERADAGSRDRVPPLGLEPRTRGLRIPEAPTQSEAQQGLAAAPSRVTAETTALGSSDRVQHLAEAIRELSPADRRRLRELLAEEGLA